MDQNEDVCKAAAETLGKIGKDAVPALIKALADNNENVRRGRTRRELIQRWGIEGHLGGR